MIAVQLQNIGLFTFANEIGQVPPGAMLTAMNVVIDKPGVVETRRGLSQFGSQLTLGAGQLINKFFAYMGRLIVHFGTTLAYDSNGSGSWVSYGGTFVPPTGQRIRSTLANGNLYLTTNNGVYKVDSLTNNPYQAGGVPALDVVVSGSASGSGFLANTSQCAYRVTFLYTDANANQIEGNPSMSVTLSNNSGGTENASLTFTVPAGLTTSYSYRIYRTLQTNSLAITPSDTFQLSVQAALTQAQINALQVVVTDITPDTLLGVLLYISPGAQGQFQTNDPPPLAKDIVTFLGMTFYFNCQTKQQFYLTLISVGSPNGIQVADTLSLVGSSTHTYTGQAANNFAAQQFKVDTSGTVSQNIDNTARNLVSAINQDTANTEFYAYYVSGFSQLPGQILIQARNLSQSSFTAISSRGGAFSPALPSSGTSYISSNNVVTNGTYVSKLNQPEGVPVTNLLFIGSSSATIYRGYALRSAVVVETSEGVFRITGTSPSNLTVTPFDPSVIQFGPDTGAVLNNSAYSFTTQGIVSVTESGSQIMSRSVEGDLLQLSAPSIYTNFSTLAFAVGYESDRKYVLFLEQNTTDTYSTLQYVYNWVTQAVTTWNLSCSAAIVNPADNRLYIGGPDGYVRRENKTFTLTDYVDDVSNVSITGVNGNVITLNSVASAVVGYTLAQGVTNGSVTNQSVITAINTNTNTVTVADTSIAWTGGAAGIYMPVNSTITYSPLTCGYPNYFKRMEPVMAFVFGASTFTSATVSFTTDIYPTGEFTTLKPTVYGNFGTFPFGTLNFGSGQVNLQPVTTFLTKNCQYFRWLNITVNLNQAFNNIALNGIFGFYDLASERSR